MPNTNINPVPRPLFSPRQDWRDASPSDFYLRAQMSDQDLQFDRYS